MYTKVFLGFQLQFAKHIAKLRNVSLVQVISDHTNISRTLHLGDQPFGDTNVVWQEYLKGLDEAESSEDWTYAFYVRQEEEKPKDIEDHSAFGCFRYAYPFRGKPTVRIHFQNHEISSVGALSKVRMGTRKIELRKMFAEIKAKHPDAETVRGGSWLYNIDAYKRLYPKAYVESASVADTYEELTFLSLWGQFFDRSWQLRPQQAEPFLVCLEEQDTVAGCYRCFPFQVLRPEYDIQAFYEFYGV